MGRLGRSSRRLPDNIETDIPVATVGEAFVRAFETRLVEQTTASWEFWYGLLERFVEREGHVRVPAAHREQGWNLFLWVTSQRSRYTKGTLWPDRAKRLEGLPGWSWAPVREYWEERWDEGLQRLGSYAEREGDTFDRPSTRKTASSWEGWLPIGVMNIGTGS